MGLLGHGCAITDLKGPADSQGSAQNLGPQACYIEEFERAAAAGFINQCGCPSPGEVRLNFVQAAHHTFSTSWCLHPVLKGACSSRLLARPKLAFSTGRWLQPVLKTSPINTTLMK